MNHIAGGTQTGGDIGGGGGGGAGGRGRGRGEVRRGGSMRPMSARVHTDSDATNFRFHQLSQQVKSQSHQVTHGYICTYRLTYNMFM